MNKTIKHILLLCLLGLTLNVTALELKSDAPKVYIVQAGDTLWDISKRYTDDPWRWTDIWYQNEQIKNPHLIFPGDEIGLININGRTQVTITKRGNASRTVKLQPNARVEPIESAIAVIPQEAIRSFLVNNRIASIKELDNAPRILAGKDSRIMLGEGEKVYARGLKAGAAIPGAYGIYRRGKIYRDPKTKEVLGHEATEIGQARSLRVNGDTLELVIEKSNQQVMSGDLLLPIEQRSIVDSYTPKAPNRAVTGQILDVNGGVSHVGQYDVVTLNLGTRNDIDIGTVLVVNKRGDIFYDRVAGERVRLPSEQAARLMVFKSFEKLSYGLIMSATESLRVGDTVTNPE